MRDYEEVFREKFAIVVEAILEQTPPHDWSYLIWKGSQMGLTEKRVRELIREMEEESTWLSQ